ncbi:MAG: DNA polymerase/3'-5' exonuclease PolX [Candidatus Omnitrophica bacterium]|nr:DNA polymerase/3'-5' exonuclease PolX [Candidatus Omnitrophota bacterium]
MKQHEIAAVFAQMADLLEYRGDNPFRIRAYRRAAQNLESFSGDLDRLATAGQLEELSGIGSDLARKITEYLSTGAIAEHERLKAAIPRGVLELLEVPGIGPKTAKLLAERLGISTIGQLEGAARAHRLRSLPGFQEKKEENILKGIVVVKKGRARLHLGIALPLANELLGVLRKMATVDRVSAAGSLRRMRETIGDLDLLASSTAPSSVIAAWRRSRFCKRVLAAGTTKASILTPEGIQVDLRVVAPESFGAALQYFTGSKEHNVRLRELAVRQGLKVNEYGVFRTKTGKRMAGREEADVYQALGLVWIPPELREDQGEIEASRSDRLPELVDAKDIRGDFHVHTTWSDGSDRLEDIARAGEGRGYQYLAICDHSQSLKVAHGMSVARLRQQVARIRALNARAKRFRLLAGAEVDILADGSMDYPNEVLAGLDFVVGAIHSGFTQGEAALTRRVVTAMRNPHVTLIAHPTGRLMGQRDPYPLDLDAVFGVAKETGTALEINAYPKRLDLCDTAAKRALDVGVMLAISTDTHSLDQLDQMAFGLGVARRAWIEPRRLLNCFPTDQLLQWIARKRASRNGGLQ